MGGSLQTDYFLGACVSREAARLQCSTGETLEVRTVVLRHTSMCMRTCARANNWPSYVGEGVV